jgi:hypothetical protein
MAFQDFISGKVSEKAALEAALVRVITELQAANNAAPAVDDAVNKIKGLISVLQSSPASVVDAAKEAIRDACGDISLLPQNKEVSTLVVPRFVVETNSPVLSDLLGETESNTDTRVTVDVTTTTSANEILPSSFTSTSNDKDTTEESSKPKRRTQAGFNRKVEEWTKKLNNLTTDNYESVIATVDDEFKYWTNGTKFESELISEKLQDSIAYWASLDQPESESKEIIEDDVPVTASSDVVETDTNETTVDLSSFNVEETTEDIQIVEEITENTTISSTEELTNENPVLESVATTTDTTQKFLDRLNSDNLSEAGLSDLQEEIRTFYGSGHIPQPLLDAQITAWERLNNDDDLDDDDAVYSEEFEIDNTPDEEPELTEVYDANDDDDDDDIYDGDIPDDEELTATDQPTENPEDIAQNKIVTDNLSWQNSILTNCETWEELKEWDKFIANAVNKNPDSVLPETFTALDTTRSKLEARDAQQAKTVDVDSLTQAWVNRAELAFDLEEIQIIYNEIKDEIKASGINPSMALIKALDAANARLTPVAPVTTVVTTKPEISDEDIADAKACIDNQWSTPSEPIEVSSTATKKNPFAGRKSSGGKITVEVELTSSEQTQNTSDSITINSINTSGVFEFQSLDGKPEKHHRFDSRYILDPGTKLFEPGTKYVFEVATWEEVISLNPLIAENPNKLPLKSLHNPKRSYSKDADKTDVFVIVSDKQANQLVQEYRAALVQMESNPNFEIGS